MCKKIVIGSEILLIKVKSKVKKLFNSITLYLNDEEGAGVIELVLILVVLIGLVIVFKDRIGSLLENIFANIDKSADSIYNK